MDLEADKIGELGKANGNGTNGTNGAHDEEDLQYLDVDSQMVIVNGNGVTTHVNGDGNGYTNGHASGNGHGNGKANGNGYHPRPDGDLDLFPPIYTRTVFEDGEPDPDVLPYAERLPKIGTYEKFNRKEAHKVLDDLLEEAMKASGMTAGSEAVAESHRKTREFLNIAYDMYEGKKSFKEVFGQDLHDVSYAFVVPARGEYSQEAVQVLDIMRHLDPHQNPEHRVLYKKFLKVLPPFVLATYEEPSLAKFPRETVGLCIYSPQDLLALEEAYDLAHKSKELSRKVKGRKETIKAKRAAANASENGAASVSMPEEPVYFRDLASHILQNRELLKFMFSRNPEKGITDYIKKITVERGSNRINEALLFAQRLTGGRIRYAGLGAVLPGISEMGMRIDRKNLYIEPTTGHRMTVYAMYKTWQRIAEQDGVLNKETTLGVIGTGSIGTSASEVTLQADPNVKLVIYDRDIDKAEKRAKALDKKYPGRVSVAKDIKDLISRTKVCYSAVTSPVEIPEDLDLNGYVMIDDSEPSSCDPAKIYARGGVMVKPVFTTPNQKTFGGKEVAFARRGLDYINGVIGDYDYGWFNGSYEFGPGLIGGWTKFGCELEAFLCHWWEKNFRRELDEKNPIALSEVVTEKHMKGIAAFERYIDELISFDNLQGAGINVSDRIKVTREDRIQFYNANQAA